MPHNNYFEFKQFTVWQNHAAMRVGTDGVLLGAWVNVKGVRTLLDIGTGTGLIALMLAQRCGANIHAIDIEDGALKDATHNFASSPWSERLSAYRSGFVEFAENPIKKYDALVCNPPFFSNSIKPDSKNREIARHNGSLSFANLVQGVARLLNPEGRFSVVLPIEIEWEFRVEASLVRLFPTRICRVKPKPSKPYKRVLMEFAIEAERIIETELTIETEQHHVYTPEFRGMVKGFYLVL